MEPSSIIAIVVGGAIGLGVFRFLIEKRESKLKKQKVRMNKKISDIRNRKNDKN